MYTAEGIRRIDLLQLKVATFALDTVGNSTANEAEFIQDWMTDLGMLSLSPSRDMRSSRYYDPGTKTVQYPAMNMSTITNLPTTCDATSSPTCLDSTPGNVPVAAAPFFVASNARTGNVTASNAVTTTACSSAIRDVSATRESDKHIQERFASWKGMVREGMERTVVNPNARYSRDIDKTDKSLGLFAFWTWITSLPGTLGTSFSLLDSFVYRYFCNIFHHNYVRD